MGCHAFLQGLFLTKGSNSQSLGSPALAGRFFTTSATCEAHIGTWSESESCSVVSDSLRPRGLYSPWNSPGQNTGVGSCSLPRGIFPTQGSNPGLPHCRWILYQLSQQGGSGATWICAECQPLPTTCGSCAMNTVKKRVLWRLNNLSPLTL